MATMTQYELVKQAAQKTGVLYKKEEVDQAIKDLSEQDPDRAVLFKRLPYTEIDARVEIEYRLMLASLMTKDVSATDDELQEYFRANPGRWDKPDKIYIKLFRVNDAPTAERVRELMERVDDMTVIQQQIDPKGSTAQMAGVDGTMVVAKPVGGRSRNPLVNVVDRVPDKGVQIIPTGRVFLVLKKIRTEPGKKMTLDEVKDKVARDYKLTRCTPAKEVLRKLWDQSDIQTENDALKSQIEWIIFQSPLDQSQKQ
jgi:foldase protein PrsA